MLRFPIPRGRRLLRTKFFFRVNRWGLCCLLFVGCATEPTQVRRSWTPSARPPQNTASLVSERELLELELTRAPAAKFLRALDTANLARTRARAVLSLARLEHRETIDVLSTSLSDADASVREHAAFGLGQVGMSLAPSHAEDDVERLRSIVARLCDAFEAESDSRVRLALLRALGRLATETGVNKLLTIAEEPKFRHDALYALGLAGAYRGKTLQYNEKLLSLVRSALFEKDMSTRRAAAFVAFRQGLSVESEMLARLRSERDMQTKIYIWRALAGTEIPEDLWRRGLADREWLVQVETLRTMAAMPTKDLSILLDAWSKKLRSQLARLRTKGRSDGGGHILSTLCDVMSASAMETPPDDIRNHLQDAEAQLAEMSDVYSPLHCGCARALDAIDGRPESVRRCVHPGWSEDRMRRLEVEVLSGVGASSWERATWLAAALEDPSVEVRGIAAWELAQIRTPNVARVVGEKLQQEKDPYVASALFTIFDSGALRPASDAVFRTLVERFKNRMAEPGVESLLVQMALVLRERNSEDAKIALAALRNVDSLRVRRVLLRALRIDRPLGEREHMTLPPPLPQLPLGAIIRTNLGDIRLAFERQKTPLAVANFTELARSGFYEGLRFHRVEPGFVAQAGDPRGDGAGGPGYEIPCEVHDGRFLRGAVGMATNARDEGGSQFFFTHSEQPHLDGQFTLFAHVVDGLNVMDALTQDDWINSVQLLGAVPAR